MSFVWSARAYFELVSSGDTDCGESDVYTSGGTPAGYRDVLVRMSSATKDDVMDRMSGRFGRAAIDRTLVSGRKWYGTSVYRILCIVLLDEVTPKEGDVVYPINTDADCDALARALRKGKSVARRRTTTRSAKAYSFVSKIEKYEQAVKSAMQTIIDIDKEFVVSTATHATLRTALKWKSKARRVHALVVECSEKIDEHLLAISESSLTGDVRREAEQKALVVKEIAGTTRAIAEAVIRRAIEMESAFDTSATD